MTDKEVTKTIPPTRRKFVWGIGVVSLFAAFASSLPFFSKKNIISCKPDSKKRTLTMLTEDGKLVQIDESLITASRKKISDQELQHWIKK